MLGLGSRSRPSAPSEGQLDVGPAANGLNVVHDLHVVEVDAWAEEAEQDDIDAETDVVGEAAFRGVEAVAGVSVEIGSDEELHAEARTAVDAAHVVGHDSVPPAADLRTHEQQPQEVRVVPADPRLDA